MIETLQAKFAYWQVNSLELVSDNDGRVSWDAAERFWVYQPHTVVIADRHSTRFPQAEIMALDSLRFRYREGKWEPDSLFSTAPLYRGIPDPSAEQVIALFEQPGVEFGLLDFAQVPRKMTLSSPPRFVPVAAGFALPRVEVDISAEVELVDFPAQMIHTAAVRFRGTVWCEVRDERWRAGPKIELLEKTTLRSRSASNEELWERHWAMDRWWRDRR